MRAGFLCAVALAACASRPAAPILDYHAVGARDRASEFDLTLPEFQQQLDHLLGAGYHTLTLREVVGRKETKKGVALTFDDGSADALEVVLPELRKRRLTATFFVITDFVGKPGYLTWEGVRALEKAGMEIGSHTAHHLRLPDLPDGLAREELAQSKRDLENHLGHRVELLAYPYNSLRRRTTALAAEVGYEIAVAGPAHGSSDRLRLYRTSIRRGMTIEQFMAAIRN
ncbi:MAG: polysaccharide deacetylase family protein [Myxococcales bacterium]